MVLTGLSVLLDERLDLLAGRRVGLVSHTAAVTPELMGIVDALIDRGVLVTALFGPEHGFAGAVADGASVDNSIDKRTRLPIYSLYGELREPAPNMLAGLDALIVDFQDIGARYYTFISTLYYVLRGAGRAGGMPVFLLDRPNPINGVTIEGPLVEPGLESFVGIVPIPIRHGMTLGELGVLMNNEYELKAPLTVIPMRGWQREMWFDQTGLPWVTPSPAMPHLSTAELYPGMCFIEGTNLSEGRGTALPFEIAGAPWLDGYALAEKLNKLLLPGVRFRPHVFKPSASKFAGELCEGVQVHVHDREAMRSVITGLHVLAACRELALESFEFLNTSAEGRPPHMDLLAGSGKIRAHLESGQKVDDLLSEWAPVRERFSRLREPYLLY
jgi:uncharacterized protein YbbC (DUF1343 family)